MTKLAKIVITLTLSMFISLTAQEGTMTVKLIVKRNGHVIHAPANVVFSFNQHTFNVVVRDGGLKIPPQLANAERFTFNANIGADQIHILDLSGKKFEQENWTLLLADEQYDENFQWVIPKGANIHSSCILAFDSLHSEPGTAVFVENCRKTLTQ